MHKSRLNGAIYVYDRFGGSFVESAMITQPARPGPGWDPSYPNIGHQIALHGDSIAASAAAGEEHIEIYQLGAAGWEFVQMVVPPNPRPGNNFGNSLDLDATTIAVGSPNTGSG